MKSWFVRCAGCGKQYTYNTHKHIRSRFAQEYCPDCCAILGEALDKIRQQFVPRWKEIDNFEDVSKILNAINEIKIPNTSFPSAFPVEYPPNGMVSGDVRVIDGVKFALCMDTLGLKHTFVCQEYDLEREEFGEKPWLVDGRDCSYPMISQKPSIAPTDVFPTEIPMPNGDFFFVDYLDKLPQPNGYPQDYGDGVWKVWDGVFGSKKISPTEH